MKVLVAGRRQGKTTKIIEYARKNNSAIVVPNSMMVGLMKKEYGAEDLKIYSFGEFMSGDCLTGRNINNIAIDNLDMLLRRLLPTALYTISAVTMTGEDWE